MFLVDKKKVPRDGILFTMKVSAIAIISKNNGLGVDNKLLFHIPGELPRFKKITMGHPIIMGRKTFDSIGRVLPGRTNILITRDTSFHKEGVLVVHSLDEAIQEAQKAEGGEEIFIIGGGQIFRDAMPITDRLYLTIVDKEVPADTFFPEYRAFTKILEKEEHTEWEVPYTFLTLEKA